MTARNADPAELQKFSDSAHRWWDLESEFKPLHAINPLRLDWIDSHAPLAGKKVLDIDYQLVAAEDFAEQHAGAFDIVTCLEMLEHVPDPASVVRACATLVKPGGHVFLSTLNRNAKSYMFAVIGAEYLLRMIPRGTHDYTKFIKPSELTRFCRDAGLEVATYTGLHYNPIGDRYFLGGNLDVNYLVHARRPA